jgi:hypothetical protein
VSSGGRIGILIPQDQLALVRDILHGGEAIGWGMASAAIVSMAASADTVNAAIIVASGEVPLGDHRKNLNECI